MTQEKGVIPLGEYQNKLDRTVKKCTKPHLLVSEKPSDLACESLQNSGAKVTGCILNEIF